MSFQSQLRDDILKSKPQTPTKITVYGVVVVPDGRILLKRSLFESGPIDKRIIQPGLWHATVSKQVLVRPELDSLKSVLFTELGMNPEIDPISIKFIGSHNSSYQFVGLIKVYIVKLTGSMKLQLSHKTQHWLLRPSNVLLEMDKDQYKFMSDAMFAFNILRRHWREVFT